MESEGKRRNIVVLFGSQTGNAEDVALRVGRTAVRLGLLVNVIDLYEYKVSDLPFEQLAVFICSTTGQGDFPDNMKPFWKFILRQDLPKCSLDSLKFCVLGLGDSSYEKYNVVAKKLNKRLLQLGAKEFLPLTLCDEQHELGSDVYVDSFLKSFIQAVMENFNISSYDNLNDTLPASQYEVYFTNENCDFNVDNVHNQPFSLYKNVAEVKSNKRLTSSDHFQAVHLIEFSIDSDVKYKPGDVAIFRPHNNVRNVEAFLSLFNFAVDSTFTLKPRQSGIALPKYLPKSTTVRNCAVSLWDIQSVPRRSFFEIFWHFSSCEIEKEKLKEFSTAEGQEELYSYCNHPHRTILEVLQDFPNTTANIPVEYLFDLLPIIRPRFFSIASSLSFHVCELHLIVGVIKYKTRLSVPRRGLCSTWLSELPCGVKVPFGIKNGSIFLPPSNDPIIMIGPGTGCAPFRAFIQERIQQGRKENYFFFGCRYQKKDFLCSKEWHTFIMQGFLKIYVAFSRDQDTKIYVQDKLCENSSLLWRLIDEQKAWIYVAGNSKKMPQDVKEAFLNIIEQEGNLEESASKAYLQKLEFHHRFQMETWS